MSTSLPSPTLAMIIDDSFELVLAPVHDQLNAMTPDAREIALRDGKIPGVEPGRAKVAATLDAAADGRWVSALGHLREALFYGVERSIGGVIFGVLILGLQEALNGDEELRAELFTVPNLLLLRGLEVELRKPHLGLNGPETDIVVTEKRPLVELQQVFLDLLGPEANASKVGMQKTVAGLERVLGQPLTPAKELASALSKLAAVAVAAGDFRSACSYVVRAFRLRQNEPEVLVAASFTWVCLCAAACDGIADPACLPSATDLLGTLQAALANEIRGATKTSTALEVSP
ncbi:MAG: hypothetical protein IT380_09910 [Myxococcales bacterium]|nr:hypothetical protein [Myxococcales bacterium]